MKILTKQTIRETARKYKDDPDVQAMAELADSKRKDIRTEQAEKNKKGKKKKRDEKPQLHATDYISARDYRKIMALTESVPAKSITRKALNRAMFAVLWNCGLRISELVNLKLEDLPTWHGKQEINIHRAKGGTSRKVEIGSELLGFLKFYVTQYKSGCDHENWLFLSEQGGKLSTQAARAKIKRVGIKAGIWTYKQNGRTKTKFHPHCMRHSAAMNLQDSSGDISTVQQFLGHKSLTSTQIYARTQPAKRQAQIEESSRKSKAESGVDLQNLTTPSEN